MVAPVLSKSEIRTLWAQAREKRLFALDAIARAADAGADDDAAAFAAEMATVERLARASADLIKQARAAERDRNNAA